MCGISCIVALSERRSRRTQKERDEITAKLEKSFEHIRHRGPDSSGLWINEDGRVALGHVRLQINDLSPSGCQPLHSSDGMVHTVVNGEIYDYPELRAEMEKKIDYQFQGTSDCELVLALYQYYGMSFLQKIRGEYSICLYDANRELFVAVRDRYGIKPLFWTIQNGELLVAAEMKAFLPLGWTPEWDVKSIVDGSYQISNATAFKGVQKVRPGHVLMCRSFGTMSEQQYWDSEYPDKYAKEPRSEEEMIQGVRDRLLDSIKQRLRADVKVGVSLSGGIDSSVVAGMVNHLIREGHQMGSEDVNERLSCFGIAFDEDSGFDESVTANRTADFLNVKFHKKHMNEQQMVDDFEAATWADEQANPDLNFIGVYALSALFREKGFTVNINGQGADEILGGYSIFLPDYLREPDDSIIVSGTTDMSESARESELARSEATLNEVYAGTLDLGPASVARRQLNNTLTPLQMLAATPILPIKAGFVPKSIDHQQTYTECLPPTSLHKIQTKWHPLHSAEYVFTKAHLQNLLLSHLGDRGEMAHSIEGRTPFLDHKLTEYVNGLPPSTKIRRDPKTGEWVEKWILREAAKPFITEELYKKRKHPYSAPLDYPVGGPMHQLLRRLVTDTNVEKLGWVNVEGGNIKGMVDEAFETRDKLMFRKVLLLAQWVVLGEKFGVKKAKTEDEELNERAGGNIMLG